MTKTGTLKELGVKPGDVVEYPGVAQYEVMENGDVISIGGRRIKLAEGIKHRYSGFRIVSRAEDTPKLWRDMTPEEKGALLLAHHEGKKFQFTRPNICNEWRDVEWRDVEWRDVDGHPSWNPCCAYRVKPEPKVETVDIIHAYDITGELYSDTHRITFRTIDGEPDCASVKMEKL